MSQTFARAEDLTLDALRAQARRCAAHQIKRRARVFAQRPIMLECLYPGLAAAPPATLIAIAEHLLETERRAPRRWFGFGGETAAINAKAALLYGRALRRTWNRQRDE